MATRRATRLRDAADVQTTVKLREALPSRRTPGKSSAHEPSAAPFDTDDEAAGRPASREAVARALAEQGAGQDPPKYPESTGSGATAASARVIVGAIVVLMVAILALVLFGALRG